LLGGRDDEEALMGAAQKDPNKKDETKRGTLEDALEDTFPASDPPAMTQPTHKSGAPKDKKSTEKAKH
jgi:hypothetical protein